MKTKIWCSLISILVLVLTLTQVGAYKAFANGNDLFIDSGQNLGDSNSYDVAMGDLDGDSDPDAFVANSEANKVWLNDGTGIFSDSGQSLGNSYSFSVGLADVDNDNDLDAFVANWLGQADEVWLNDGSGNFINSGQTLGNDRSLDVAMGDLDNDGDIDALVAIENGSNKIWLNNGTGIFTDSGQRLGNSAHYGVTLGDIDGDGDLDAFFAKSSWPDGQSDEVWLNNGSGSFEDSGQRLGHSRSNYAALGDLDSDGDLDVFIANYAQPNAIWLNDGSGIFYDTGQGLGIYGSSEVALDDLDGDGDLDAFVANDNTGPDKVWLNNGVGTFTDSGLSLGHDYGTGLVLMDVDDDGDLDAFVANGAGHWWPNKVWLNTSATEHTFQIDVRPMDPNIRLTDVTPDSTVDLDVYKHQGGPHILDLTLETSSDGEASWDGWGSGVYLVPGTYIVATDNGTNPLITRTFTVIDALYEMVDVEADQAVGHAPAGTEVEVTFRKFASDDGTIPGQEDSLRVTADENGRWVADFGAEGIDIPPYAIHKITVEVWVDDSPVGYLIDTAPEIFVTPYGLESGIWIKSFTPDSPVTVEVYEGPGEYLVIGPHTLQTDPSGAVFFKASPWGGLLPGYYVVVTDEATGVSKTHVIESVDLEVDAENDVASGNALPGARVFVRYFDSGTTVQINTYADENGHWLADFGTKGVDLPAGYVDLDAQVYDEDFDSTYVLANQTPIITSIDAPTVPVLLGQSIDATITFSDSDPDDTHSVTWDWGDGLTTTAPAAPPSASASHTYTTPGVYTVKATITDMAGDSDTATFQYVVIYDPEGGFVTGGGWIWSPEGAYTPDPSLTGKATFGFVSKYKKGASVPTGNTEFQFKVADLNFKSISYDWLVIAGSKAKYKGTGTINGTGEYKFMLSAIDGTPDMFRIKIWDKATEVVVYDNQIGVADDADPVTAIGGGSIVVHKEK
ncbi:MAG: VCBS repeat-containing protein [Anaerolineales bacterium]|nr:VCBS repeat-containing protein [Anaerolineales bacterium]